MQDVSTRTNGKLRLSPGTLYGSIKRLLERGMQLQNQPPKIGRDGKWQLNLYDPNFTRAELMDGVPDMIHEVQVEATFPDGTKLVTVHDPIQ